MGGSVFEVSPARRRVAASARCQQHCSPLGEGDWQLRRTTIQSGNLSLRSHPRGVHACIIGNWHEKGGRYDPGWDWTLGTGGKTKCPCPALRPDRDRLGDGSAPRSLSRTSIWHPLQGCWFPDAILHGKRSYRPRSRAVHGFATDGFLSEAFQLASAGGCATGLRTRSRHACIRFAS